MSSRICVKNLPRKCTEMRLREHFAAQGGEITDLRIMRKADGSSRMFGFVGYKTDKMATAAKNYFDGTFMGTVKIAVEVARTRGDEELARPWSKHSKGSSAYELAAERRGERPEGGAPPATSKRTERERAADDPKLREYLALMRPKGAAGKFWAADGEADAGDALAESKAARKPLKAVSKQVSVPNRKTGGEGLSVIKTHVTFEEEEEEEEEALAAAASHAESDDEYQTMGAEADARAPASGGAGASAVASAMSDLDYLKSKQRVASLSDEEDEEEEGGEDEEAAEDVPDSPAPDSEGEAAERAERADADADDAGGVAEGGAAAEAAARESGADLAETGRLFVRNLSYDVSDDEITALFKRFGPLADVHVPVDGTSKRGKGFAYAQFMLPEHAVRALAELDGSIFQGRIIHLLPAALQRAALRRAEAEAEAGANFKAAKDAKRRSAAQLPVGWNSLFMGADAVAAAAAEGLGLSKAQLLGPDAADAAVRLALGETSIVVLTKAWFEAHGLNARALDALDEAREAAASAGRADIARSRTVILVKNLPPGVGEPALHAQFGRYGSIARLLLPPARTLALVEFAAIPEARRAFAGMAYRKLGEGQQPLYLEWAPQALLEPPTAAERAEPRARGGAACGDGADDAQSGDDGDDESDEADDEADGADDEAGEPRAEARARGKPAPSAAKPAPKPAGGDDDDDALPVGAGRSLYVKNLNFKTDEAALRELFEKRFREHAVKSVIIARKADRKQPGKSLSMGYGFVEFATQHAAKEVLKAATTPAAKALVLDEHTLALKLSTHAAGARTASAPPAHTAERRLSAAPQGKPSRKLTVRNVPFEASKRELQELFGSFGELQSVRVPKKFDGKHRGFAFVEYLSKQDAVKAMEALGNTHLYGRHLVLEWAADEQSLDALRDKAKRNLDNSQKASDAKRLRAQEEGAFDADADVGAGDQMLLTS